MKTFKEIANDLIEEQIANDTQPCWIGENLNWLGWNISDQRVRMQTLSRYEFVIARPHSSTQPTVLLYKSNTGKWSYVPTKSVFKAKQIAEAMAKEVERAHNIISLQDQVEDSDLDGWFSDLHDLSFTTSFGHTFEIKNGLAYGVAGIRPANGGIVVNSRAYLRVTFNGDFGTSVLELPSVKSALEVTKIILRHS